MGFKFKRVDIVGGSEEFPTGSSYILRRSRSETVLKKCVQAIFDCGYGWSLDTNKNQTTEDFANVPCINSENTYPGLFLSNSQSGCKMFISYFGGGVGDDAIKDFKDPVPGVSRQDLFAFGQTYTAGLCISILPPNSEHDYGTTFDGTFLPNEATRIIGTALYWTSGNGDASYTYNPNAGVHYCWGLFVTPYTVAVSTSYAKNVNPNLGTPAYACGRIIGTLAHEEDSAVNAKYGILNFREGSSDQEGTRTLRRFSKTLWDGSIYVPLTRLDTNQNIWDPTSASISAADGTWRNGNFDSYNNSIIYVSDFVQLNPRIYSASNSSRWVPICAATISTNLTTYGIVEGDGFKGYIDTDLFRAAIGTYCQMYDNGNFICTDNNLNLIVGWDPLNTDTLNVI